MMKEILRNSGVAGKILQLLILTLFLLFVASIAVLLILKNNQENMSMLKLAQAIQSLALFSLPPIILVSIWSNRPLSLLKLDSTGNPRVALWVVLLMIAVIPCVNFLSDINNSIVFPEFLAGLESAMRNMEDTAAAMTVKLLYAENFGVLLLNLFIIAVIPAIGEELYFRGVLQPLIQKQWGMHAAVWVTAIIFSAIHFQFFGFLPRMLLGALMGYLMVWTGSLWMPILAHFINNGMAVVYYYFKSRGATPIDLETAGKFGTWYYVIPAVLLVILLVRLINKDGSGGRNRSALADD